MEHTRWFKDKVFYQIWPRSFLDGNGDGIGDLIGVYEKLDYIQSLGVDGIWFSPLYPSPNVDCGYDIADYTDIAVEYGGMEAFRKVLDGAHSRGMKVIMDLVVNHTSDEHEWFQKSRRRIEPYTDYYIWRSANSDGSLPNNWDSWFEGKAWAWDEVRQEYYLHLFAIKQPDLNMDNPLVREEVKKVLRFWLDLGVDGFREDVVTLISKEPGLPDGHETAAPLGLSKYNHGPRIHEYLQEFRRDVLDHYDCMTLAEAPSITTGIALDYIAGPDNEIDMMIQFDSMCACCEFDDYVERPFSLRKLKKAWSSWQNDLDGKGWNMLYIENHDHPRVISRYGSERYWKESGKMLATAYLFQKGTPFIYQGQEIGMLNWRPASPEQYEDVHTLWQYHNAETDKTDRERLERLWRCSRDSARTGVQWSDRCNAGFTDGTPWFAVNDNYDTINVLQQEGDETSILNYYRKAIALRKKLDVVQNGTYEEHFHENEKLYIYSRCTAEERLLVICSFSDECETLLLPEGFSAETAQMLLCNYERAEEMLAPWECRVYHWAQNEAQNPICERN